MSKFIIEGGNSLKGEVVVAGNKNSVFPLFAAALIADSPTVLENVPKIRDVDILFELIKNLGGKVDNDGQGKITIDPEGIKDYTLNSELAGKIRGSIVLAAPLIIKFGKVRFPRPGGDFVGIRSLNEHLKVFEAFGAKANGDAINFDIKVDKLWPAEIFLD